MGKGKGFLEDSVGGHVEAVDWESEDLIQQYEFSYMQYTDEV